jgi:serine/threonine protein kinase
VTLAARTRLGPYEIIAPIGAGGMGEVYRAKDTRLDRHVAVKVLPARSVGDAQAEARFGVFAWSPNGTRLAVVRTNISGDIVLITGIR